MSRLAHSTEARLALILLAVVALMGALAPDRFLTVQNATSMAFQFPEFAILALATALAMLTGGIDLSVVGIANLTSILAALLLTQVAPGAEAGWGWLFLAYVVALSAGALAGLLNGVLVALLGLPPILATLGSGLVFTGLAVALTGGTAVMGLPPEAATLGNGSLWGLPVPLLVFAALAGGLGLVLARTGFGFEVRMFGANPLAARYAAMDTDRLLLKVYAVSGLLAAIAGLVIMSRANSAKADYGSSYLLLAVLIAVLGGVNPYGGAGRIIGVVLAVVTLQVLSSGLNMLQVTNFARELIWGALLILVMILNTATWRRRRGPAPADTPAPTGGPP